MRAYGNWTRIRLKTSAAVFSHLPWIILEAITSDQDNHHIVLSKHGYLGRGGIEDGLAVKFSVRAAPYLRASYL